MEKVEAFDVLEDSWFFENLFDRRRRMLRCYSDPCTSPNFRQDVLSNDSCHESRDGSVRGPSLPLPIGMVRKHNGGKIELNRQLSLQASKTMSSDCKIHYDVREKKIDGKIRSRGEPSRRNLLRTPSLPSKMERNELNQDKESDIRMSKLIRQAMANSPDILPPRHSPNKAMNFNINETTVRRGRHLRSHSDLAIQELQGFKDLGFTFDNHDLSPDVVNILPGLQGTTIDEPKQEKARRKPYLSEAWHAPRPPPPPPLPARVSKNSAEDMKAQIKFWARAVATNVRQEC